MKSNFNHDVANQLAIIKLSTSLLEKLLREKDKLSDEDLNKIIRYLENINEASIKAKKLATEANPQN